MLPVFGMLNHTLDYRNDQFDHSFAANGQSLLNAIRVLFPIISSSKKYYTRYVILHVSGAGNIVHSTMFKSHDTRQLYMITPDYVILTRRRYLFDK